MEKVLDGICNLEEFYKVLIWVWVCFKRIKDTSENKTLFFSNYSSAYVETQNKKIDVKIEIIEKPRLIKHKIRQSCFSAPLLDKGNVPGCRCENSWEHYFISAS